MNPYADLLQDARELIDILQGHRINPLLEQWKLARRRRESELTNLQRILPGLLCWLLSLGIYWLCLLLGERSQSEYNFAIFLVLATVPASQLAARGFSIFPPRRKREILVVALAVIVFMAFICSGSTNLWLVAGNLLFSDGLIPKISMLVALPLLLYMYAALHKGLIHGLELTGNMNINSSGITGRDIQSSPLLDKEILQAYLALHIPVIGKRLVLLGLAVLLLLIMQCLALQSAWPALALALIGCVVFIVSGFAASLILMLMTIQMRLFGQTKQTYLLIPWILIVGQLCLSLSGILAIQIDFWYEPFSIADTTNMGWSAFILTLILALPSSLALLRSGVQQGRQIGQAILILLVCFPLTVLALCAVLDESVTPDILLMQPVRLAVGLLLVFAGAFLLSFRSTNLRLGLVILPSLFGLLCFLLQFNSMDIWINDWRVTVAELPIELTEMLRALEVLTVASGFSGQFQQSVWSSDIWGLSWFNWWRLPLHFGLQALLLSMLYRNALAQVRIWRRDDE